MSGNEIGSGNDGYNRFGNVFWLRHLSQNCFFGIGFEDVLVRIAKPFWFEIAKQLAANKKW
ncbi:hypothetical protein N8787_03305 [Opitutaceae bacterium]|nr:hypothetical protein [Opitutaceae bacterium]